MFFDILFCSKMPEQRISLPKLICVIDPVFLIMLQIYKRPLKSGTN